MTWTLSQQNPNNLATTVPHEPGESATVEIGIESFGIDLGNIVATTSVQDFDPVIATLPVVEPQR